MRIKIEFGRLHVLLVLTLVVLLFQIFPSLWFHLLAAMDVRNWSRTVWTTINICAVISLICIRFGPELCDEWRRRRSDLARDREKQAKQLELNELKKMLERVRNSRNRRIY